MQNFENDAQNHTTSEHKTKLFCMRISII